VALCVPQRLEAGRAQVDYAVVSITEQGIGDRLTLDGAATPWEDRLFASGFALVPRPFPKPS
jgi:hypothetical protein